GVGGRGRDLGLGVRDDHLEGAPADAGPLADDAARLVDLVDGELDAERLLAADRRGWTRELAERADRDLLRAERAAGDEGTDGGGGKGSPARSQHVTARDVAHVEASCLDDAYTARPTATVVPRSSRTSTSPTLTARPPRRVRAMATGSPRRAGRR